MDRLIDIVSERAGIQRDQAEKAVNAMLGFLKETPDQLSTLLGDDLGTRLSGIFGR
ncbi:MAG: hypothetical protein IT304_06405 [Dehalococcoidia bacterium]|nr:hypothetical protein [Dehalococcoidia bacterium]